MRRYTGTKMSSPLCITYQGSANAYEALSDRIIGGLQKPTDWERSFGRRCVNMQLQVDFMSFEESLTEVKAERVVVSPTPLACGLGPLAAQPAPSAPARAAPVVLHLYFSDCQTAEGYKASRVREQITVWLSEIRSHHPCQEWAVIVLANTDAGSSARLTGSSSSRLPFKSSHTSAMSSASSAGQSGVSSISFSSSGSSGKFEVADRIRADFCSRSLSDKHRCLVFRSPKSKNFQQDEFWWSSVNELRAVIFDIAERKLRMYEESVRRLREDRQHGNFNILQCFCTQNHLASEYQQLGLHEDALLQLDEMDAMLTLFIEESHQKATTDVLRRSCRDFNSPNLALFQHSPSSLSSAQVVHRQVRDYVQAVQHVLAYVAANATSHSVLERYDINMVRLRNHLFMRQCYLLILLQRSWEIPQRAVAVVHCLLHELTTLLSRKTLVSGAVDDAVVIRTKEQYLNALNAWSFLLALQCIEVANNQARNNNVSSTPSGGSVRSEINFSSDDGPSAVSSAGTVPAFSNLRVQQANATLLDIARLKLRELGTRQRIAPVIDAFDFAAVLADGNNSVRPEATATNDDAVITDFESILPVTFPFDARQRLLRALASSSGFTSYYLEFSEFVLGTCKHVGRIRGARLIGKELASYYVSAGEPEKATAFLRDAIKSYRFEGWSQLAISSMALYAECCYRTGNFERAVKDALLVACSTSENHSLETRRRFMQLAFHSANKQLMLQTQGRDAVFEKHSPTSPPAPPSGPKTIKTTQILCVCSVRRCNGDYPLFVSDLPSNLYADDRRRSISDDVNERPGDSDSTSTSPVTADAASEPSYSRVMLKLIVRSALPDPIVVNCSSIKCLMRHRPLGFRHKRSVSVVGADLLQQKSVHSDPTYPQRQIPLLSSSSSSHGSSGVQKGSSLPRHYSAMNFSQLAKQQNFEQQEVSANTEMPPSSSNSKSRPDFLGEFTSGARRPVSAHVSGAAKHVADNDDSAALAALSSSASSVARTRKHDLVQRLMSRPSVSGPDHFLALKQEQSGMTSNKSLNLGDLRRKQSALSRMSSVMGGAGSASISNGGKFMNVKRVLTYGTSAPAPAVRMPHSSGVSGPLTSAADADVRSEQNSFAGGVTGPSSAKSTPSHRGLAASALRKSATKASKLFSSSSSSSALASSAVDSVSDDGTGRNVDAGGTESDPLFVGAASSAPSDSLLGGEAIPSLSLQQSAATTKDEEDAVSISRVSVASFGSAATGTAKPGALALAPVGRDSFRARATVTSAGLICMPHESLMAMMLGSPVATRATTTWRAAGSSATSPTHDLCVDALSLTPSRTESVPYAAGSSAVLERGNSIFTGSEEVDAGDDDADTTPSEDADETDGVSARAQKVPQRSNIVRLAASDIVAGRHHSITENSQAASLYANSDEVAAAVDQQHFVVLKAANASGTHNGQLSLQPGVNTLLFEGQLDEAGSYEPFALFIELVPGVLNIFSPIPTESELVNSPGAFSPTKTLSEQRECPSEIYVDNRPPQITVLTDSGELYDAVPQTFSLKLFVPQHYHPTASQTGGGLASNKNLDINVRLLCRPVASADDAPTSSLGDAELRKASPVPEPVFLPKSYKERQNSCWAVGSLLNEDVVDSGRITGRNEKMVRLRSDRNFESEPMEALIPANNNAAEMELLVVVDYPWSSSRTNGAGDVVHVRERSSTEATLVEGKAGDLNITATSGGNVNATTDDGADSTQKCQLVLARHKIRNTFGVETRQIATCKPDEHMLQVVLTCRYAARFLLHNPMLELLLPREQQSDVKIVGDAMGAQNFRSSWMPFKQGSRAVFTWRLATLPHDNNHPNKEKNDCKFLFSMDYGVDERLYGADALNKTTDINAFVSHLMAYKQDSNAHVSVSGRHSGATSSRNSIEIGDGDARYKDKNSTVIAMPFRLQNVISANVQSRLVNVRICLRDQNKPLCRLGEQFFVKYRISIALGSAVESNHTNAADGSPTKTDDMPLDLYYRVRLPVNQDSPDWKVMSGETGSLSLKAGNALASVNTQTAAHAVESGDNVPAHSTANTDTNSSQPRSAGEGDAARRRGIPTSSDDAGSQTIQPILQPLRSGILQIPKLQLFMYRRAGLEELTSTSVYYENPCVLITVFVEEMPNNNENGVLVSDSEEIEVR